MPTCPGCYRRVSHQRLPVHSRYCPKVLANTPDGEVQATSMEQLHRTVSTVERRLENRIEQLEHSLSEVRAELPPRRERQ